MSILIVYFHQTNKDCNEKLQFNFIEGLNKIKKYLILLVVLKRFYWFINKIILSNQLLSL